KGTRPAAFDRPAEALRRLLKARDDRFHPFAPHFDLNPPQLLAQVSLAEGRHAEFRADVKPDQMGGEAIRQVQARGNSLFTSLRTVQLYQEVLVGHRRLLPY